MKGDITRANKLADYFDFLSMTTKESLKAGPNVGYSISQQVIIQIEYHLAYECADQLDAVY